MKIETLIEDSKSLGSTFYLDKGTIHSVDPPETMFGYTCHAHMIPPFKPDNMLMLGYGKGTVAHLTRKIWGTPIKITAIDIKKHDYGYNEYEFKKMDAFDFVKENTKSFLFKKKYDYIVIDLFDGDEVVEYIFNVEFIIRLKEMSTKIVCINAKLDNQIKERLKSYNDYGFFYDRCVEVGGQIVTFWSV